MKLITVFLTVYLCLFSKGEDTSEQQTESQNKAFEITSSLYTSLRNLVFPEHKLTSNAGGGIQNRFLLLMPGKVLNYFDYFPGKDYVNFIQKYEVKKREAVVPPHVMEKWFDITDEMPSPNPLNGQSTGKSLANIYSSILDEMTVLGTNIESGSYTEAINYLRELVTDPNNTSASIPRLALYERYRDMYNDRKLSMEDTIEKMRTTMGSLDYELWFQRHYPSLQSKAESAYTSWLIFGEKENVEAKMTLLDTGSVGEVLEDARTTLRAAGVEALDRSRKIYPVSFEPSDWYKYLLPEAQKLSRDQLQMMLGKVTSKINAIEAMISALSNKASAVTKLKNEYSSNSNATRQLMSDYIQSELDCVSDETGVSGACSQYNNLSEQAINQLVEEAKSFLIYQFANDFNQSKGSYISYLQKEKESLIVQSNKISAQLSESSPFLGGILESSQLEVAALADTYRDDRWMKFEYNSQQSYINKDSEATSESVTANMHFHVLFFSGGGSYSYSKDTSDYNAQLANSTMTVKGEFLRVNIKRPWFKPEVFENQDITYKASGDKATYIAPGRELSEDSFYERLISDDFPDYKLPEYTTAFLLARKIELEFSGIDANTTTSTMSEMSQVNGGGGFLFFHASASVTKAKQTSHVQVKKTANGMKISIPGAQLIGYFTEVLPRFPYNQEQ